MEHDTHVPATSSVLTAATRRELWGIRVFFLLLTGSAAFYSPFLGLFYRQNGLSGMQIGLLATVTSVASLIAAPVWGRWNDRAARPRLVLQVALALATVCTFLLSQQRVFLGFLIVVGVYALINSGTEPITNRLALSVAKRAGSTGFGSIRLWGSLGWAVMVLLSGWLTERTGTLFTAFAGTMVLLMISIFVLNFIAGQPEPDPNSQAATGDVVSAQAAAPEKKPGWRADAAHLLRDRVLLGLAGALILQWLVLSGVYQFQSIYLNQLGAGEGLIGIVWMISAAVELPGMWWADRLIRRYGSGWLLAMGFLLEGLRTIPVLLWPSVAALIGAELINGLAYSFLWIGMVVYVSDITSSRRATTMQALYTVTLPGLTQILGGPLTGLAFDRFGAYWLYVLALVGSLAACIVFWVANRPVRSEKP